MDMSTESDKKHVRPSHVKNSNMIINYNYPNLLEYSFRHKQASAWTRYWYSMSHIQMKHLAGLRMWVGYLARYWMSENSSHPAGFQMCHPDPDSSS